MKEVKVRADAAFMLSYNCSLAYKFLQGQMMFPFVSILLFCEHFFFSFFGH